MQGFKRITILFSIVPGFLLAQSQPEIGFDSYKSKYPTDDCILLQKKESVDINIKEGRPEVISTTYEEVYWLTDKAQFQRKDAISYGMFDKLVNISAKSLVPENNKFREFPVNKFDVTDYIESGVFFDDIKVVSYDYPKLTKGSKTVKQYKNRIDDLHFLTGFDFGSFMPVEKAELSISLPQNMKMSYRLINCNNYNIQYSQQKKGQKIIHTWVTQNVNKVDYEEDAPGSRYVSPHIIYYIENYQQNGMNFKVYSDVNNLYSWYYSLTENIKPENEQVLKKLVDSLTLGVTIELEKVKKIYYWVQGNIKYIAIEYGFGGFQPRPADLVFNRRYGDCKDMANLIYTLLKEAGINSHLTWVGTRDIPYSYREIPTPVVDNHMIVTYINGTTHYYLDATGSFQPIAMPSAFIQGKEALVGYDATHCEIDTIPEMNASANIRKDSIFLLINSEGLLSGNGTTTFTGYYNIEFNRMLKDINKEAMNKELQKTYQKGSNKYHVLTSNTENAGIRDSSAKLFYSFEISDLVMRDDSNIYLNMILNKTYQSSKINKDRKNDYVFNYKGIEKNITVLEIPRGYKMSHIPENSELKFDGFGYALTYEVYDNRVICTITITHDLLMLKKENVADWNAMIVSLQNAYNNAIVLKKNGT
jgi:transglutaminase-like putative cysteine protease